MTDTQTSAASKAAKANGKAPPPPASPFDDLDALKTTSAPERPSPFDDLDALRLSDPADLTAEVEQLTYIPVRKPKPREFFRVNADPSWMLNTAVFVVKSGMEDTYYIVMPDAWSDLGDECRPVVLRLCMSRQGAPFIWPQPSPSGGKGWALSAHAAAELAKTKWVRIKGNTARGEYSVFAAEGEIPEPAWPDRSFQELLKLGFGNNVVFGVDDAVVRRELKAAR